MKENGEVTDTNVEDIEEALEKLSTGKKIKLYELLRTFKREGIENFVTTRKKYVDVILSDYKRVLKENEELRKKLNEENKRCMMLAIEKQDYFEKYRYHLQQNESLTKEFSNVIPVQKIKDKIEGLKAQYKTALEENTTEAFILKCQITILKELIEEREEK